MAETDKVFSGDIARFYDRYLVPLIFLSYAHDLAARISAAAPDDVLETAAGSGVVTRALAPRLGPRARYVVTDLNAPMLDHARAQQSSDKRLSWQTADALNLPFDAKSFDTVACQFGAMFFPDKVKGFAEARRVLKPGGRFVFNVWDRIEDNEFAHVVTEALSALTPDDPPVFLARTPHGYSDIDTVRGHLAEAGFRDVSVETLAAESRAEGPDIPARAYCEGTPLRSEIEARHPGRLEEITKIAARAIAADYGRGRVSAKIQAHVFTAVA